jgi:hypothetical protein
VAGPNLLVLDGVSIGSAPYAVYLSADDGGTWRVTSVEPISERTIPQDVRLDMTELSTSSAGELRIDNIYLDGRFYSGTVSFDPSYREVESYGFSITTPPDPEQNEFMAQLAESYGIDRAAPTAATPSPSSAPPTPPPSVDQNRVLERLDQYANQGAQRLDRLERRIEELARRVDDAVEEGSTAVAGLMRRVAEPTATEDRSAPAAERVADSVAPTLSLSRARSEMATVDTLDLSDGTAVTGRWQSDGPLSVSQTDPHARFAKLTLPYRQDSRPRLYRLLTRAPGDGWVGVGLHLGVTDVQLPEGYGHGRSILVWLTRDVQAYGDETTFLEVYISYDDVTMNRVAQTALDTDLSATSAIEVLMDPGAGMVTIAVDGVEQFRYRINLPQGAGLELALRALGRGEFSDLEVRRR